MKMDSQIAGYLDQVKLPAADSHKGHNGKLLIIGGSELFHAASKWSLDIASKFVDMVFYSSVPSNNELVKEAKGEFWNGIVVPREQLEEYLAEADCVLIGPGMTREREANNEWRKALLSIVEWEIGIGKSNERIARRKQNRKVSVELEKTLLKNLDWNTDTYAVTNYLLAKYPQKKWVIDAGALQMLEPFLLNQNMIITPHYQELSIVFDNLKSSVNEWEEKHVKEYEDIEVGGTVFVGGGDFLHSRYHSWGLSDFVETWEADESFNKNVNEPGAKSLSMELGGPTVLLKGKVDTVTNGEEVVPVQGGNAGMTKGGTGDVLAGLVAALYCTHDAMTAAVVGSYINKKAGEKLFEEVGPYFNASDLVEAIPRVLWNEK